MKNSLMRTTRRLLGLASLALASSGALAYWDHAGYDHAAIHQSRWFTQQIDARQDRQLDRIHAGRREGRLTRAEFRNLMHEQREIRAMERHFLADGLLDEREFRRLDRALDFASRNIRAEKHDAPGRYAYNSRPWHE